MMMMIQWHTCTLRHALRAAYRTAISAAQILVNQLFHRNMLEIFNSIRDVAKLAGKEAQDQVFVLEQG